jgi:hypothetical protein
MASRENQGFQVALIVFVMLTVLLSVTTFVLFRNYNFEKTRADANDRTRTEAEQAKSSMKDERDQYLTYLGVSTTEKKEAIDDIWKKDMAGAVALMVPNNLPEDQRSYKKVLDGLLATVRSHAADKQKMAAELREAKANYDAKTAEYEKAKQDLTKEKDEKIAAYEAARKQIADELDQLNVSKTKMAEDIAAKEKAWAASKQQYDEQVAKMNEKLGKMQTQIQLKSDDYNKVTSQYTVNSQPDGKIVEVSARENLAFINLGSDDLLRKRITFSVYDPSTTDVTSGKSKNAGTDKNAVMISSAKKKGTIEVIDVTGPHMAECRIIESTNSDPILRNDVIFTPLWRPGQQEHFALAGLLDVDGKGVNDRAKIHDIIHQHGGVIDAETDDQGTMKGAVTYSTRYLIKGTNDKAGTKDSGYNQLTSDAAALGVETVDLAKFLDMMGYTPKKAEDKTVLNAKSPTPGQPNTNFRPRTPPPTKAGASGSPGAGY